MEELKTFTQYLCFVGDVFYAILEQNRKLGNTCMELKKFSQKACEYAFIDPDNVLAYLEFYSDEILCLDNLVGFKEDYQKDVVIQQRVLERLTRRSLSNLKITANSKLNTDQKTAVKEAPKTDISIVTGGAGTGKTTIINQMLKNFNATYHGAKKAFVLTPTGKAARRAKETITEDCEISTVHYFAGWGHPLCRRDYQRIRSADFIIVDEVSMLSAAMFYILINITEAPMVLVGDINQLPAVEAGNILKDLIDIGVPAYYLNTNYRSQDDILTNANAFLDETGFKGLITSENFQMQKITEEESAECLANTGADIILTPYRKEEIAGSCTSINNILHEQRGFDRGIYHVGEPVIIMNSNKKKGYVNGETGYVTAVTLDEIYVDLGDRVVAVKEEKDLDLNYASTIHKSQGSEYDTVAIYCPNTAMMTKNILYTAITRAKHRVMIYYTEDNIFEKAYQRNAYARSTFLSTLAA